MNANNIFVAVVLLAASQAAPAQTPSYTVTDLGTLGGSSSTAFAINNLGQVLGSAATAKINPKTQAPESHVFLWEKGKMVDITQQGMEVTVVHGNPDNRGRVVGQRRTKDGRRIIGVWSHGSFRPLPVPSSIHTVLVVNANGQILGQTANLQLENTAYLVQTGRALMTSRFTPHSLSDLGIVAGREEISKTPDGEVTGWHAALWNGKTVTRLPVPERFTMSEAEAVNKGGDAVGYINLRFYGINQKAVRWHHGQCFMLGSLSNASAMMANDETDDSAAYDISNTGLIVGTSQGHAFLWRSGQMIDLNTRIPKSSPWTLECAYAINSQGQIVGYGSVPDPRLAGSKPRHAFLLTPIRP